MKPTETFWLGLGIAMVLLIIAACSREDIPANLEDNPRFRTITIEGCEYIEFDAGVGHSRVYSLTHKGNCKNPIHKQP